MISSSGSNMKLKPFSCTSTCKQISSCKHVSTKFFREQAWNDNHDEEDDDDDDNHNDKHFII